MNTGEDEPILYEYRAKNGEVLEFDISRSACEKFGFYYTDRVDTPLGAASVVGVRDKCLWFHVDGDAGASFWDNGKNYVELLSLGISLMPQEKAIPDVKGYKVKNILYKGKKVSVVLQNENGPCPLIGISNVLVLRGDIVIEGEGANKNVVTLETLNDKLSGYLYEVNVEKGDDALAMVEKASKLMPSLQVGLDVNFNFKDYANFEQTEQCKLFGMFNIRLVHGWLVDPEDLEMRNAIGDNTYNDLMNKLVALDAPSPASTPPSSAVSSAPQTAEPQPTSPSVADGSQKKSRRRVPKETRRATKTSNSRGLQTRDADKRILADDAKPAYCHWLSSTPVISRRRRVSCFL